MEQRAPEGETRVEEGEYFRDENTSLEHSLFTEALCNSYPPKQQGRRSNNLWTAQKPKGPDLVPTQTAPFAQESSRWRVMEAEKSQGREMS